MKKWFALLLTAVMLIGLMSAALAYNDEITFQGIAWGSSADEVISKIYELGLVEEGKELSLKKGFGVETTMASDGNIIMHYKDNHADEAIFCVYISSPNIAIDGLEVAEIAFQFAANEEKSELICITMRMADKSEETYESIVSLLNEKYGKGIKDKSFGMGDPCMIYSGTNDTAVTMHRNGMADYNILQYGKTNGLNILLTYLSPVEEESIEKTDRGV